MSPKNLHKEPHYDFYTGGKTPEFTIFFNIALQRVLRLIFYWSDSGRNVPAQAALDNEYKKFQEIFLKHNFTNVPRSEDLPDIVYSKLRDYLWKGYMTNKNSSGHVLTEAEKKIIRMIVYKLFALRNFHSHVWHPNKELKFDSFPSTAPDGSVRDKKDAALADFVQGKHDTLLMELSVNNNKLINKYQQKKDKIGLFKEGWITQYGRTFFLSFFLTTGEMNRFIQQREKDVKNTELKHWMNRYILTQYSHRDGATRHVYNHEENILDMLPEDDRATIIHARNAYQMINYLNDVPATANNTELYPLLISNGISLKPAQTAEEVKKFCALNNWFSDYHISVAVKPPKRTQQTGTVITEHSRTMLEFTLKTSAPPIPILLSAHTVHKLILDSMRADSNKNRICEALEIYLSERDVLIRIIQTLKAYDEQAREQEEFKELNSTLEEYKKFKLKGDDELERKFENWYYDFRYQWKPRIHARGKYHNIINPEQESRKALLEELQNKPIELTYHDFSFKHGQKSRAEDMFCIYVVRFLCNFGLTEKWQWQFESFENEDRKDRETGEIRSVNKRHTEFSSTWLDKKRLSYSNGNVRFKYGEFIFDIGHKALKTLLIVFFEKNNGKEKNSAALLQSIKDSFTAYADMHYKRASQLGNNLKAGGGTTLDEINKDTDVPLNNFELPRHLRLSIGDAVQNDEILKEKIKRRIEHISKQLGAMRDNATSINRNGKNEQIMKCYRLYHWHYPGQQEFKFLRRDEYNRMSMYHYMMGKRSGLKEILNEPFDSRLTRDEIRRNDNAKRGARTGITKIETLLTEGGENSIAKRMPNEIATMLQDASNLDELFMLAIDGAITQLKKWKKALAKNSREELSVIIQKLDLPAVVTEGNKQEVMANWQKRFEHQALSIHPLSVITFFYGDEYAKALEESRKNSLPDKKEALRPAFGLAYKVWRNKLITNSLRTEHYNYGSYLQWLQLLPDVKTEELEVKGIKNIRRHIIGKNNEQLTEDGLLFQMVMHYLDSSQSDIMQALRTAITGKEDTFKVGSMRKVDVVLKTNVDGRPVRLPLKFHQLDDYLIIENKKDMELAIAHLLMRRGNDPKNPLLPDGQGIYTIAYIDVVTEMTRVFQQALFVAKAILDWEKDVIDAMQTRPEADWISFDKVLQHTGLDEKKAEIIRKDLRNIAFHGGIPKRYTYASKMQELEVYKILGVDRGKILTYLGSAKQVS